MEMEKEEKADHHHENGSTSTVTITDHQIDDEPEINYRGIKAMPFVIGNETFEKLGTTGTSSNLLVYLTTVFNMKSITATNLVNIFNGTCSFATLIGAFLSDAYFGRYNTLGFASLSSLLGMILITLTAAVSELHPPACDESSGRVTSCVGATAWQMAFLVSGLGLLVVGAGGIRPCNLAFGADQFNPKTESGKRGISSFFNWYYFTFTFAMMLSLTVIVYVQSEVSWAWGLGIPAFMILSCFAFFVGSRIYVKVKPEGSPITTVVQVIVAAFRKRKSKLPDQPWTSLFNHIPKVTTNSKLSYTDQFKFLNKAAILTADDEINPDGSAANPWKLCSLQKVEEIKCVIRVIPIWATGVIYYIAMAEQQTYVVFQVLQSDTRFANTGFHIPAASFGIFIMISLTVWIPIYDRLILPCLQKYTNKEGGITVLQKMGIGMVLGVIAMIISAIVEDRRRALALIRPIGIDSRRGAISPLSAMWYIPQLTLIGLSEAFTIISLMELYYKQFPENMRSIAGSFTHIGFAVSNYLNSLLISVVHQTTNKASTGNWLPEDLNKGKLDYFYYLIAALQVLNLGCFIVCAKWYKYKENATITPEIGMENLQQSDEKHVV